MSVLRKILPFATAVCLCLIIIGAKWDLATRAGSDMPNWDQWDAEAINLFGPWYGNDHFGRALFTPHNEHRVVMSKLEGLTLVLLGGHWDARVQTTVNAVLHTSVALAFFLLGRRWLMALAPGMPARAHVLLRGVWFVAVAACFALPLGWHNTISGFHSQQYWLLLTSFTVLVILPFTHPRERLWWLGALAGVMSLLTMGSGFLAAAAVLVVLGFRLLRRSTTVREIWPTVLLCVALCAIGWLTRVEVDYHAELKATSVSEYLLYLMRSLQWPELLTPYAALVLWLPWAGIVYWAFRHPTERALATLAGIGGWVMLQLLATAYARGAGATYPAPRYADTLLIGIALNAVALLWQVARIWPARGARYGTLAFAALWVVTASHGLYFQAWKNEHDDIPLSAPRYRLLEENMRGYLATNDIAFLERPEIPYPGAEALKQRLDLPNIRQLMPVTGRPALEVTTAAASGFVASDSRRKPYLLPAAPRSGISPATASIPVYQVFGSYTEAGAAATGTWRSAPMKATPGSWLKFEIAGALADGSAVSLTLNDAQTGRPLAAVHPRRAPGDAWHAAYVRAPAGEFTINAADTSPDQWLAFSAPTEMTRLSHAAWVISKQGWLIFQLAIAASILLGLAVFITARPRDI